MKNLFNLTQKQVQEIVIVLLLLIVTAAISVFSAYVFSTLDLERDTTKSSDQVDLETGDYPDKMQEFINTYEKLLEQHYTDVDESILLKGAIEGMLEAFEDEYTSYIDEYERYQFQQRVDGRYQGIGIGLYDNEDGAIEVTEVFEDSPAEKAGVQVGDIIIGLDGQDLDDKEAQFLVEYVRDYEADTIAVTFLRDGEEITYEIGVETIVLTSVEGELVEKEGYQIGYLEISVFALNTYSQMIEYLDEFGDEIDGLIIDVRYNTGGYLATARRVISNFLDDSHVIYRTEENDEEQSFYSTGNETADYPIVLLGNQYSASASEILIAALQESYGASFVGEQTYGK